MHNEVRTALVRLIDFVAASLLAALAVGTGRAKIAAIRKTAATATAMPRIDCFSDFIFITSRCIVFGFRFKRRCCVAALSDSDACCCGDMPDRNRSREIAP